MNASTTIIIIVLLVVLVAVSVIIVLSKRSKPAASKPTLQKSSDEQFEDAYREELSQDIDLNTIQIMGMDEPLATMKTYIKRQLGEFPPDILDSAHLNNFNQLLEKEEDRLQVSFRGNTIDIKDKKHCVIVGHPGIGKTTFLKYLALQEISGGTRKLPLYVNLHIFAKETFTSKDKDLLQFIASKHSERYTLKPEYALKSNGMFKDKILHCIRTNLEKGNVLLLLDALDETLIGENVKEADKHYNDICKIITTLAENDQAQIIVTSRNKIPALEKFNQLYLSGFSLENREEFVKKWFAARKLSGDERKDGLLVRLQGSYRLRSLAANPLFLSIMALIYDQQSGIPERHAELYKQCADALLYKWDNSRGKIRQYKFTRSNKEALLKEIAWHFSEQRIYALDKEEVLTVVAAFLPRKKIEAEKAGEVLEEITTRYGLLKIVDQNYEFLHPIFQEYFVAQNVKDRQREDGWKILLKHAGDPRWREIIYLYVAYSSDVQPFLESLDKDIFYTNWLLIGHYVAATNPGSRTDKAVDGLFSVLEETSYKSLRDKVAATLVDIGGPDVNKRLFAMLEKDASQLVVQKSIISAFEQYGQQQADNKQVGNELASILVFNNVDPLMRIDIALTLGALKDHSVVPTLKELLANSQEHSELRSSLAAALGKLGDVSVVPALPKLLADPKLPFEVGKKIAMALSELDALSTIPELLKLLSAGKIHIEVRQEIIITLARLDKNGAETKQAFKDLLKKDLVELPLCLRIKIVLALWEKGAMRTNALQLFADKHIPLDIRRELVLFLEEIEASPLAIALVPLLSKEQIETAIRVDLAEVLGKLSSRSSELKTITSELITYMSDIKIDARIRSKIIHALEVLEEKNAVEKILELLKKDSDPSKKDSDLSKSEVWESCARFLIVRNKYIKDVENTIADLRTLKNKANVTTRFAYEKTDIPIILGNLGDKSVLPDLETLLLEPKLEMNAWRRKGLTDALVKVGDDSTVNRLRDMPFAYHLDREVRQNVLEVLKLLAKDKDTCKILIGHLVQASDIADEIYDTLQVISARGGLRVFRVLDNNLSGQRIGTTMEHIEVEVWRNKLG